MAWRNIAVFSALMALSGCGTPLVPLSIYAVNGLSYASSGKGVTDHAISAATDRDCAVLNLPQTGGICRADPATRQQPALAMVGGRATTADDRRALVRMIDQAEGWRDGERTQEPADEAPEARPAPPPVRQSVPFN